MDELINQFSSAFESTLSITNYILNIVICAIMLLILSFFYSRFGNSISNRGQLAKVLVIVGITTFIINNTVLFRDNYHIKCDLVILVSI